MERLLFVFFVLLLGSGFGFGVGEIEILAAVRTAHGDERGGGGERACDGGNLKFETVGERARMADLSFFRAS